MTRAPAAWSALELDFQVTMEERHSLTRDQ